MNLSFRSHDPLNTLIINSANGYALYHTETHNVVDRTTQIKKFIPGAQEGAQGVAEVHWETLTFNSPKLLYRGQQLRVSEYLVKDGIFSRSRTFIAGDGRQYKWKIDSLEKFRLYDSSSNLIVESHKNHIGLLHKAQDYNVDVMPAGMSILDDIIVSFIIMRHLEMKRKSNQNTAVIAGMT
ncbi:hypothetical protein M422DRAFT_254930 [Sphaerobolus stellatus SS14]|uniref:DUF6593 domain-containing protein n=1 Tax=Sphaerobolus stellatus (strain SS14) TaxID=990650 RepID=A0A0C9V525_SPHS4|nr:hypothetical protein M422DRAFT_254930 [Sphaerobolus stellatus SS14]